MSIPYEPQEVDAVADLGRAADGCPCAEDAGDWLPLPGDYLVLHIGSVAFGWTRAESWRIVADPDARVRELHRARMNDLIFNQIPNHHRRSRDCAFCCSTPSERLSAMPAKCCSAAPRRSPAPSPHRREPTSPSTVPP